MAAKNATSSTASKTPRAKADRPAAASPKTSSARGRKSATPNDENQATEVTLDRRRSKRRDAESGKAAAPTLERRTKVQRRRQIDPTTCERDYSDDEVNFMNALDEYKRKNGRMFPTCSEVLEVIRNLGYVKLTPVELAQLRPETTLDRGATDTAFEADELEAVCL
jgi:hypothetical protein